MSKIVSNQCNDKDRLLDSMCEMNDKEYMPSDVAMKLAEVLGDQSYSYEVGSLMTDPSNKLKSEKSFLHENTVLQQQGIFNWHMEKQLEDHLIPMISDDNGFTSILETNLMAEITQQQNKLILALQQSQQHLTNSVERVSQAVSHGLQHLTLTMYNMSQSLKHSQDQFVEKAQQDVIMSVSTFTQTTEGNVLSGKPSSPLGTLRSVSTNDIGCQTDIETASQSTTINSVASSIRFSEQCSSSVQSKDHCSCAKETKSCNLDCRHSIIQNRPYDGKQKWNVWYKQFKVGTKGWSREDKLKEILMLMQGPAAEFVYDELPDETLTNYKTLVKKLKIRFREIEIPEKYAFQFENRDQLTTESVQEYGAELTRLYRKAHPGRDTECVQEDVLRRWLDGVSDREAAKQIEFIKTPVTLEQAITAMVQLDYLNCKSDCRDASVGDKTSDIHQTNIHIQQDGSNKYSPLPNTETHTSANVHVQRTSVQPRWRGIKYGCSQPNLQRSNSHPKHRRKPGKNFVCYKCHGLNHIARNCPVQLIPMSDSTGYPTSNMPQSYPFLNNPSTANYSQPY